jgi:hypothetical protein
MQVWARKKKSAENPFRRPLALESSNPPALIHKRCG